jgi:hypothetical protein
MTVKEMEAVQRTFRALWLLHKRLSGILRCNQPPNLIALEVVLP